MPYDFQHLPFLSASATPFAPPSPPPPPMPPYTAPPPYPPYDVDPFSEWLLSLVGWEYPLRLSQQAMLVSLLGVGCLLLAIVLLLLLTVGVTAACEDIFALLRGECCLCWARFRGSGKGTFVLLDEGTDVQAAAIAAAELADGAPRGIAPEVEESGYSATPNRSPLRFVGPPATDFVQSEALRGAALTGRALPDPVAEHEKYEGGPSISSRFGDGEGPPILAMGSHRGGAPSTPPPMAPRGERGLPPSQRLAITPNSGAATSRGMASNRCSPQLSTRAATARASTCRLAAEQAMSQQTPGNSWDDIGWKDKSNPSWYGV